MAPLEPHASPFADITTIIVATPPLAYRITLWICSILVVCATIGFFATEKRKKKDDDRKLATAISADPFIKRDEATLQDFLEKMTDDELDRDFIIPIDKRERLTFRRLKDFVYSKDADLSRFGVSGNDRIATILGDGPEAAVAFWAFSAQCSFCPVNHKATNEEIDFLLHDLTDKKSGATMKAVVVYKEDVERVRGFTLIECTRDSRFGGLFFLNAAKETSVRKVPRKKEDIALVIQTSGTTKKPKMVPLSHDNLILCAKTIVQMIGLHHEDRSLNFLPLFHIGGIANNVIAPVLSNSSVITAEDFTGEKAYNWLVEHEPTWYYGSPTTHILMMKDHETPRAHRLRLIRNATAALLPSVAEEMDNFWNCEILPGYGMSECTPIASHHIGCRVKLDCVGPATGPPVRIARFDDEKRTLEDVPSGEICIQGPCVFKGYEVRDHMHGENPNDDAFIGGWFRTGDNGVRDSETKYYKITGRAKEIIIRGGENISPFEVEDQVQDPRVTEKAVFAIQHQQLGEVVALAVVTSVPGEDCSTLLKTLKKAANLDPRKLPEIIIKVDAFPKNNLKKIKRMDLQKAVQKLLKVRDLYSQDPTAYYFISGGKDGKDRLTEYEDEDGEEEEEAEAVDSLGLTKAKGGAQIPDDIKNVIMAMYAMAAFGVVSYHGQIFLLYPKDTSPIGLALVHMMCGNVIGGMRWTMQCFMSCASYLQCKEPFSVTRVVILCILYFAYQWPIAPIITFFAELFSNEPVEAWYVMVDKRWFVGIMIFSYCSFAFLRQFAFYDEANPGKLYIPASLQCAFWIILTLCLNIWPVNNMAVANWAPEWVDFWFQDIITCGLFVWVGCIMIYFIVGYYGHDAVTRILAHPLAHDHKFQSGLTQSAPFIFLIALFAQMYGPQQSIGIDLERAGYSWKWDPVTVVLDQITSLGMIAMLSQMVRNYADWVKNVGACSLGIYLGGDIIFYCPYTQVDKLGASFGIIIDHYEAIPTLQRMIYWTAGFWPAMVVMVFIYTCFQIFVFGIPFHMMYLKFINLCEFISQKTGLKKVGS
jgi:acyl-CoA synthetase (AMP-forming)/AMP-acid ligase II